MTQGEGFQGTPLLLHLVGHALHVVLKGHVLLLQLLDVVSGSVNSTGSVLGDLLHGFDLLGVVGDLTRHLLLHPDHGVSVVSQLLANLVKLVANLVEFGVQQLDELVFLSSHGTDT